MFAAILVVLMYTWRWGNLLLKSKIYDEQVPVEVRERGGGREEGGKREGEEKREKRVKVVMREEREGGNSETYCSPDFGLAAERKRDRRLLRCGCIFISFFTSYYFSVATLVYLICFL